MDYRHYSTERTERKKGQHLQREERGAIQHLKRQGFSNRAIARENGYAPSTVANELRLYSVKPKSLVLPQKFPGDCQQNSLVVAK